MVEGASKCEQKVAGFQLCWGGGSLELAGQNMLSQLPTPHGSKHLDV